MSGGHIGLIILFSAGFIAAVMAVVFAAPINNRLFDWGKRLMKKMGLGDNVEYQRVWSLWATRIFGALVAVYCAVVLYFLFLHSDW
jgi:hypothetical protein